MNYINIWFCVGVAALVTVATYIILDPFSRSKKKKYNPPESDTVKSERKKTPNEAAGSEMKKPPNEAVGSERKKPPNEAVGSEMKKPPNKAVRFEIKKSQNAATNFEIKRPQSEAAKYDMKKSTNGTLWSERKKPPNEAVRSEMKKPPNEAVRSEIKKSQNAATNFEIKRLQSEAARYDMKKPTNGALGSEIKKPRNPAVRSKIKNDIAIEKPQKQRPNYFVAIQISDSQIINSLRELQQHILDKDPCLMEGMKKLTTLHITLMVMYICDAEKARALDTLENIHREHDDDLSKNPLKLEFKGLGHFNNKVLYAKLLANDSYGRLISLAESVRNHYASASIFSTDSRTHINPHLTVVNVQDAWKIKELPRKIDPSLYKDFNDRYFGIQEVQNIQLLSMADERDESGYYLGKTIYFSAFESKIRPNYRNKMLETEKTKRVHHDYCKKMLETEETKQSIIQMINSLKKHE